MNVVGNQCAVRGEQGFEVFILSNQEVELAVVPELGARIISLKDVRTGREWLWHPAGRRKLFRNRTGDNFERSPLVGLDECLPTIAPCSWQERDLPDHGEVWAAAWSLDFQWDRVEKDMLGLWPNHGGWHGHHQFALAPAKGDEDVLTVAARRKRCGSVAPHGSVAWEVCIRVGN